MPTGEAPKDLLEPKEAKVGAKWLAGVRVGEGTM